MEFLVRRREVSEAAWADFVKSYSRYVYAISTQAFGLSGKDLARVFDEVFARAWNRFEGFGGDLTDQSWVARMTRALSSDCFGTDAERHADGTYTEMELF